MIENLNGRKSVLTQNSKIPSQGVNFTIILRAPFTPTDPKSAKKDSQVKHLFALLGSVSVKVVRKHVYEIDPRMGKIQPQMIIYYISQVCLI